MEKISNSPEETYVLGKLLGGQSNLVRCTVWTGTLVWEKPSLPRGLQPGLALTSR